MAVTGAIFNSLIYGGVDSAEYGVYITGDAVFNAPKRSVELVSVPGRNGAIEIDQGHFENIEVSYPAGMFGDDKTDFRERLSEFRNAIMSQKGYQRLTDTYHPDEYRMGIYVEGLEVEPTHYNEAGQFTLKFNCKPQRWLTSGEEPLDVMDFRGETYEDNVPYLLRRSAGGETSVPFDMEKDTLIGGSIAWNQLCNASSVTVPNGHKYYMIKGGTASVGASTGSAITGLTSGTDIVIDLTATFGTEIADYVYGLEQSTAGSGIAWLKSYGFLTKDYFAYNDGSLVSVKTTAHVMRDEDDTIIGNYPLDSDLELRGIPKLSNGSLYYDGDTYTADGTVNRKYGIVDLGTLNWYYESANTRFKSTSALPNAKTPSSSTVFDVNAISAMYSVVPYSQLTADKTLTIIFTSSGEAGRVWAKNLAYTDAQSFKTAMSGVYLIYELATPTTETADSFASPQIVSPLGTEEYVDERSVPVPVGHRTVYGMDPSVIVNPTLFDAGPLLEVEGYGVVDINQHEITLENKRLGEIQLTNKTTADGSSLTVTFDASALNEGDEIYIKDFNRNKVMRYAEFNSSFNTIEVSLESESIEAWYDVSYNTVDGSAVDFWAIPDFRGISFEYGTANSSTKQTDYIVDWGDGSPSYTYALVAELSYDGANSVTLSIPTPNTASIPDTCTIAALFADSSLLILGDKTYIDCEIGEAYMIQDGSIISLNSAVDLGSELPTLKPGINRIIFDDTFTELIITPRWWKI